MKRIKTLQQLNKFKTFIDSVNIESFKNGNYKKLPFWTSMKSNQFQIPHPIFQEQLEEELLNQLYSFNKLRIESTIDKLKETIKAYNEDIPKLIELSINEFQKICLLKLNQTEKRNEDNDDEYKYDFRNLTQLNDFLPKEALKHIDQKLKQENDQNYQQKQIKSFYELIAHQNEIILNKQKKNVFMDNINPVFISKNIENHKMQKNKQNQNKFQKSRNYQQNNNNYSRNYRKYKNYSNSRNYKNHRNNYKYNHHHNTNNHKNKFKNKQNKNNKQFNNYNKLNSDLIDVLPSYSAIKIKLQQNKDDKMELDQDEINNQRKL